MLQGFWGGVILSIVNQAIVFLVLGGLAVTILVVRKLLTWTEAHVPAPPRPAVSPLPQRTRPGGTPPSSGRARIAAITAAVHAFAGAAPGCLRVVGIARIGVDSTWKAVGRMEAMGTDPGRGGRLH
jgi:hypothetical protein